METLSLLEPDIKVEPFATPQHLGAQVIDPACYERGNVPVEELGIRSQEGRHQIHQPVGDAGQQDGVLFQQFGELERRFDDLLFGVVLQFGRSLLGLFQEQI